MEKDDLGECFTIATCPRLEKRNENMVIANRWIARGQTIYESPWMGHVSFMAPTPAHDQGAGPSGALAAGTYISNDFVKQTSPAHLQLTCTLIKDHPDHAQSWVRNNSFLTNRGTAVYELTPAKHKVAIGWLKKQGVPMSTLIYWANRDHFRSLYDMMTCNAHSLELALSETTIGLVFCPILALFNHDCVPNATVQRLPTGFRVTAAEDIQQGEEICFSYNNDPVGLVSLLEVEYTLYTRYGFHCQCPTHRCEGGAGGALLEQSSDRPLYRKRVQFPRSLPAVYREHALVEAEMKLIGAHYKNERWDDVRKVCERLASSSFSAISSEPRLAFAISLRYIMTVPYCIPSEESEKWLALFLYVVQRYCANPVLLARGYFMQMLHIIRKVNIVAWNTETKQQENMFPGCQGRDLTTFLLAYVNLRRVVNQVYGETPWMVNPGTKVDFALADTSSALITVESLLFSGLSEYLTMMQESIAEVERLLGNHPTSVTGGDSKKSNLTTNKQMVHIVNHLVTLDQFAKVMQHRDGTDGTNSTTAASSGSSGVTTLEMEDLVLLNNHALHADEFSAEELARLRKLRNRQTCSPATRGGGSGQRATTTKKKKKKLSKKNQAVKVIAAKQAKKKAAKLQRRLATMTKEAETMTKELEAAGLEHRGWITLGEWIRDEQDGGFIFLPDQLDVAGA